MQREKKPVGAGSLPSPTSGFWSATGLGSSPHRLPQSWPTLYRGREDPTPKPARMLMRKGSCSRPGRRSPTRCRSSAGDTCGPSWPQYEAYYNGRRPIAAASSTRPARPPCRQSLPGADQAPTRPRRPYQRIRAGRIEATVKTGGRVLDPTGQYFSGPGSWFGPGCAGLRRPGVSPDR